MSDGNGARACTWEQLLEPNVFVSAACECKTFKQIILHKIEFECPPSPYGITTTDLHSQSTIYRSLTPPKFWDKRPKATTKVTLTSHQIKQQRISPRGE